MGAVERPVKSSLSWLAASGMRDTKVGWKQNDVRIRKQREYNSRFKIEEAKKVEGGGVGWQSYHHAVQFVLVSSKPPL